MILCNYITECNSNSIVLYLKTHTVFYTVSMPESYIVLMPIPEIH